ncbi:hypothetical protein [Rhodanobacter soli]
MATVDLMSSAEHAEHRRRIKRCRGTACFAELALVMGTHSTNRLESLLYPERAASSKQVPALRTGICRQWRSGKVPSDDSVARALQCSGGNANLGYWRDLPLWDLLREPSELTAQQLHNVFVHLGPEVRQILFVMTMPDDHGEFARIDLHDGDIASLRALGTLDAFIALLALARIAHLVRNDQHLAVLTSSAFAILANILAKCRQLEACADDLFLCLTASFWSYFYLGNFQPYRGQELIQAHLVALRNDPSASCDVRIGYLGVEKGRSTVSRLANYFYSVLGGSAPGR